ncbi:MAG: AEC family transporter [Ignavibacteria bacterium]
MGDLLIIPFCLVVGYILRKTNLFPAESYKILNSILIYICLPALTLLYIPEIDINTNLLFPTITCWLMFGISVVIFLILKKPLKLDNRTTGALILTSGLANTSFVGFPVLIATLGEEGLKVGVVIDSAGSFLIISTVSIFVASFFAGETVSIKNTFVNVIKFPPFIFFLIALILKFSGYSYPQWVKSFLHRIGDPVIFLALISVGFQLKLEVEKQMIKELIIGLSLKMIIIPLLIYLLFMIWLDRSSIYFKASIIEAAMPPMVMGAVLATTFELNPKLANIMVGAGIFVSAITLPLWFWVLK